MSLILLIVIPLVAGLLSFALSESGAKVLALLAALVTLFLGAQLCMQVDVPLMVDHTWIPMLGVHFALKADGMATMLCLLTSVVYVILLLNNWNKSVEQGNRFYGLLMLAAAGLMGVFLAADMFLFYIFWELALIPVYFLCSMWGGEKRITVTFKFFVYTFLGSLIMLAAILFLSSQSMDAATFLWSNIIATGSGLSSNYQVLLFCFIFIAFAIKMPIFPFHTWQPDTYEQSATPVTIVLSALMVKMGIYAVVRWLIPVLPDGVAFWSDTVIVLSLIGIIYASLLAFVQDDMKRLIAYSSIAHMGLMSAAAFVHTDTATHGLMVQMFNHGINIAGMWLIVSMVERNYGTRKMSELGGMAGAAPRMAIAFVIIAFANIALPLTNAFVGEFMMFNGIFQSENAHHILYMVVAGLGVILGAVYTLGMVQKVAFGNAKSTMAYGDISWNEWLALAIVVALILVLGVYPQPLLDLTATVTK